MRYEDMRGERRSTGPAFVARVCVNISRCSRRDSRRWHRRAPKGADAQPAAVSSRACPRRSGNARRWAPPAHVGEPALFLRHRGLLNLAFRSQAPNCEELRKTRGASVRQLPRRRFQFGRNLPGRIVDDRDPAKRRRIAESYLLPSNGGRQAIISPAQLRQFRLPG